MRALTELELNIIHLLSQNARISNEDISAMLNADVSEVSASIQTLEKEGVLLKYIALVKEGVLQDNPHAIKALIEISVRPEKKNRLRCHCLKN